MILIPRIRVRISDLIVRIHGLCVVKEAYSFHWYMFKAGTTTQEVIVREDEHRDYNWIAPKKRVAL